MVDEAIHETDGIQETIDALAKQGIYVVQDFESHCKVCDTKDALRMGACWHCAEAESIIYDGVDMYDKGLDSSGDGFKGDKGTPAKTAMQKLELLIQKGWRYKPENARLEQEVTRLRTALEHYADDRRWQVPLHLDGTEAQGRTRYFGMADHGYSVAQAALAHARRLKEEK